MDTQSRPGVMLYFDDVVPAIEAMDDGQLGPSFGPSLTMPGTERYLSLTAWGSLPLPCSGQRSIGTGSGTQSKSFTAFIWSIVAS